MEFKEFLIDNHFEDLLKRDSLITPIKYCPDRYINKLASKKKVKKALVLAPKNRRKTRDPMVGSNTKTTASRRCVLSLNIGGNPFIY